jgi:hypothetical protein
VNQAVAQPNVNESFGEKSECNIPTDSQHANRTQSTIRDLDELRSKGKEKAMTQDQTEDVAREDTPTSTQNAIGELLELLKELREKKVQRNLHSSPHYGAGSFAQPHTNPTPDASRSSDGSPSMSVTKVYHHYHYHYNAPNVSTPPIINKNIVRINNKNTANGSDSSESGDDDGEYQFLNGFVVDIDF